jgi:archaellum component FlaC
MFCVKRSLSTHCALIRFTNGQIAYINSVVNGVVQSRINNYVKNYDNIIDSALKSMRGIKYDANDLDDSVEELKGNDLRIEGLVIELRNRTIALESQQKETKDIDYSYRLITDARLKSLESKTLY